MKKILAIVLMAAVLVCPAFASGAAAATTATASQADCNHAFSVEITKEATCTEKGLLTYTCSLCGLTYTVETVPTGEHSYVASVKDATCTEDGAITYTCSVCGDSYTEVIPAAGHTPSAAAATCTEPVVCTVCGTVLEEAVGHSYTYQYDAVVNEDGTYADFGTWKCDVCGDVVAATEGNAVYYYSLQEAASASGEASAEASAEETVEVANPNYDPEAHNWGTIEIVMAIIIVVVFAVLMLSFGKAVPAARKKED